MSRYTAILAIGKNSKAIVLKWWNKWNCSRGRHNWELTLDEPRKINYSRHCVFTCKQCAKTVEFNRYGIFCYSASLYIFFGKYWPITYWQTFYEKPVPVSYEERVFGKIREKIVIIPEKKIERCEFQLDGMAWRTGIIYRSDEKDVTEAFLF